MALNLAAIAGVAVLALNLGQQIQRTTRSLETEREAAADLYALHEDIVRSLSSGLITVSLHGRVLALNQAACDILGCEPGGALGRAVNALLPGVEAVLDRVAPDGTLRRGDLLVPGDPDDRYFGVSVSPLRNNRDQLIGRIINFQDLTELRRMEAQVKRAERLAALGTLAAGIAHEIRNPLASISGSIELLRGAPADDVAALMAIVTREVDRLNAMIADLLDYANPQRRELVPFDLAALVDETLRVFVQDRGFEGIEVRLAAGSPTEGIRLEGDPAKLRQVLWNLLRNAAEAAAGGGKHVSVRVGGDDLTSTVEVTDDGPGLDPTVLERVFDPFFTTKRSGTGLGLATSHNIVADHGGRIEVDSQPGKGATFKVILPRKPVEHGGAGKDYTGDA